MTPNLLAYLTGVMSKDSALGPLPMSILSGFLSPSGSWLWVPTRISISSFSLPRPCTPDSCSPAAPPVTYQSPGLTSYTFPSQLLSTPVFQLSGQNPGVIRNFFLSHILHSLLLWGPISDSLEICPESGHFSHLPLPSSPAPACLGPYSSLLSSYLPSNPASPSVSSAHSTQEPLKMWGGSCHSSAQIPQCLPTSLWVEARVFILTYAWDPDNLFGPVSYTISTQQYWPS